MVGYRIAFLFSLYRAQSSKALENYQCNRTVRCRVHNIKVIVLNHNFFDGVVQSYLMFSFYSPIRLSSFYTPNKINAAVLGDFSVRKHSKLVQPLTPSQAYAGPCYSFKLLLRIATVVVMAREFYHYQHHGKYTSFQGCTTEIPVLFTGDIITGWTISILYGGYGSYYSLLYN